MIPALTTDPVTLAVVAGLAYLLGSIPFGVVITRVMGLGDVRAIGSGNIGATNVLRTGSKGAALATLLLDGAKGGVAVLLARWWTGAEDAAQVAALMSFMGHLFPVWLGFKGGKGVATFYGTLLALAWPVGLAAMAVWLAVAAALRISSLAALVSVGTAQILAWLFGAPQLIALLTVLAVLVFWRHRPNIKRLFAGTEPRFGRK
jgi:glycerol-3-phosphate acyltransferase PlsY